MVVLVLLLTLAFAKENFRVVPSSTSNAEICMNASPSLCNPVDGCCSGHGFCDVTNVSEPFCSCDVPIACHSSWSTPYGSPICATNVIGDSLGSPDGCCLSDTYDVQQHITGGCNQRTGTDPEMGATGRLLKRVSGAALFDDDISTPYNWASPYDSVDDIADFLMDAGRPAVTYTDFTMLNLAFLEFAREDVVSYALQGTNHTIEGLDFPDLRPQVLTGTSWGLTPVSSQFENVATGEIDADPVYVRASRISQIVGNTTDLGPYIDISPVLAYYSDLHYSQEFLVIVELLGEYHNFLVQNFELYLCATHSKSVSFDHTIDCLPSWITVYDTNQKVYDRLFDIARSSTMRFLQAAVGGSALHLLAPNDEPCFDFFWNPDQARDWVCEQSTGVYDQGSYTPTSPIRDGNEFDPQHTRSDPLRQLAVTGIDFLLSMREPVNLSDTVLPNPTCGIAIPALLQKIILLSKTHTRKFGSRIDPSFATELKEQLTRIRTLGIESYNTHISAMTGSPTPRTSDTDIYLGLHLDTDSGDGDYDTARLFNGDGVPSLLLAIMTPINDALMKDEIGYWKQDSNNDYLPQPYPVAEIDFASCDPPSGLIACSDPIKMQAWAALTGWRSGADYTVMDMVFKGQSPLFVLPTCAQPGLTGTLVNIGAVHHSIFFPLIYDYTSDATFPSYAYWNDPVIDVSFQAASNAITSCIPWLVGKTSAIDSTCCEAPALGSCHEYVNPWEMASLCPYAYPY